MKIEEDTCAMQLITLVKKLMISKVLHFLIIEPFFFVGTDQRILEVKQEDFVVDSRYQKIIILL